MAYVLAVFEKTELVTLGQTHAQGAHAQVTEATSKAFTPWLGTKFAADTVHRCQPLFKGLIPVRAIQRLG